MHWPNGIGYTNAASSWYNTGTNIMPAGTLTNTVNGATGLAGQAATNVSYIVTAVAFPVPLSVGDEIYVMGPVSTLQIGSGTNALNGDDIFSGNYGRPVIVSWVDSAPPWKLPAPTGCHPSAPITTARPINPALTYD